jgi:hypothetical protein
MRPPAAVAAKEHQPPESATLPLWRQSIPTLLLAGAAFLFEAVVAQQGFFASLLLFVAVVVLLPRALLAWRRPDVLRVRLFRVAVYLVVCPLALGHVMWNNRLAAERAEQIIAACRQFEAAHQRPPAQLGELVPHFLPAVPAPRSLTLNMSPFWYVADPKHPGRYQLIYVAVPPFGKRTYSFAEGQWRFRG